MDWILGVYGAYRRVAQKQYREFVRHGINKQSPWEKFQGQIVLGEDGFIETFKELVRNKETAREIPRQQRYAGRPDLREVFNKKGSCGKDGRNQGVYDAHVTHGYSLKEIADHLGIHYTTVSKAIKEREHKK
ncbi:MAG: hypothetical protein JSW15_06770 [Deltaproteobacteria bacterium]|nr:MAG: hypothetical protein JSW15_06770 [Deltaproteobacteria bacterium]